jgi:kynurenine formamidase
MSAGSRIVDLSVALRTGLTIYPGDPGVRIEPALRVPAGDGVNVLAVHMGSQSGTHVDAPYHVLEDGARLDELPLERFLGPAVVADVRHVAAESAIGVADLEPVRDRLGPGAILLLHTGWSRHFGDPDRYRRHPWLSPEAAHLVVALGVLCVGIDAFSVDPTPLDVSSARLDAHLAILGPGGVIVENLTNLGALAVLRRPVVSVLPLNIAHADGAPVRAVAYEGPPS